MNTILITGGAGFIGGNFVLLTLRRPDVKVINLDNLTYAGNMETLASVTGNPRHVFIRGDIRNRSLIRDILAEHDPCAIVNFAAESHVDRSIDSPGEFIQTNIVGTFDLLESARAHYNALDGARRDNFRFLHVSTDEVYGSLGPDGKFTEATPYAPNSPYAASKAASDHLVRAYHHTYGMPTLTTNCSNNYGPYQFPEKLIPLMIYKALKGEPLPVYGDGMQVRDWLYVSDHCAAIWTVLEKGSPGEVYNIGGNCEMANISVVKTILSALDEMAPGDGKAPRDGLITYVKDRPGHDRRYAMDTAKIRRELGWEPVESFDSGIRKTIRWYLDNQRWVERVMSGEYLGERIGLGVARVK